MIATNCMTLYGLFIKVGVFARHLLTTHATDMNLIRHAVARQFFVVFPQLIWSSYQLN